ncbi:roundabout homolog 1-like [Montipora capricornis]|uniref:roundabout homolog 1-like n=1 Tax=Montipora capricornis TaxID=246305 RepID=UPI0035F17D67
MFKFYFLLALLSSEIDGIYGGAFMFTQIPNPSVYFMNGSNAVVEWKYSVDNRMADFQYIVWGVQVGGQRTPVMIENATGHLTYTAAYAGRVEKRGQATLVLKDVTFKDSGIYLTCSLIHTSRRQSDSSTGLTITGQASLQPQAQFASFLGSVVFICNATNVPKESFSWLKRHGQTRMMLVDNGQNVTINSAIGSSILTLKNVAEYNKGYYTCDATANVDQSNFVESYLQLPETLKLDGTFSSGRPIFAAVNETQKTLCCPVIGYPPPIVTWEKNGTMLQTGENKCFTIASVKSGHFGNYSCIATDGKTTTDPFVLSLVEKEEPGKLQL